MIASLRGKLEYTGPDWGIIEVGGVGFQVFMPSSTLNRLSSSQEVKVFTHTHVREDALALYGFATHDELRLFEMLLGVSGVGPRLALTMLSGMSVEQITSAIAGGNADLLLSVPGVGKKTASRLVMELKDKIGEDWREVTFAPTAYDSDVLAALIALGYSTGEAMRAIASLPPDSKLTLEDKVKTALGYLGK